MTDISDLGAEVEVVTDALEPSTPFDRQLTTTTSAVRIVAALADQLRAGRFLIDQTLLLTEANVRIAALEAENDKLHGRLEPLWRVAMVVANENERLREEVDASWKEIRRSHRLQITNCNCSICKALATTEASE